MSTRAYRRLLAALGIGLFAASSVLAHDGTAAATTGSSWTIVRSPDAGSGSNQLAGVSCPSASACAAVGYYVNSSGTSETLAETWNGTAWSTATSPNKGSAGDQLDGVSCTTSTSCMSVGDYGDSSGNVETLVEGWNGTTWSIVPSPDPSKNADYLTGISCTGKSFCVAVGDSGVDYSKTLILSWNGTTWSVIASPDPGDSGNALNAVSCVSATHCVAVGTSETSAGEHETLVESWNGTTWTVTPSPNKASDSLYGVSCTGPTGCMAVGSYFNQGSARTLTESWNGTDWSIVASPSSGGSSIISLNAVWCTGSTSCFAVGSNNSTLVESWNGSTWSVASSQSKGLGSWLNGVSCTTAGSCTAVGDYAKSVGTDKNLVEVS